ncbi:Endonuclease/exonuclease/phosphatase family protein [Melia azedarach]|uniref:Endonuclease/exonuclease/phosphatase family protein n=1 Tax=Melia azedarach TaxID=155640 RepID=A0ACC1XSI7_MELAZ|nr:Endonuclease/exonuclease/phosphatase family protein [Melia azedarach]
MRFLQTQRSEILLLCETKTVAAQMNKVHKKLNYDHYFSVNRIGMSGSLALLWNSGYDLQISSYSKRHIGAIIKQENG